MGSERDRRAALRKARKRELATLTAINRATWGESKRGWESRIKRRPFGF